MSDTLLQPLNDAPDLVALLRVRAQQQPDQLAYTFLLDGEAAEARMTYAELDQQARAARRADPALAAAGSTDTALSQPLDGRRRAAPYKTA